MSVGKALADGVLTLYGCLLLTVSLGYALLQRETWLGPRKEERAVFAEISHKLWSLDDATSPFDHGFLTLRDGLQLHYLSARPRLRTRATHLVIFLHGFPDSCHLFSRVLTSDLAKDAQLVSLDLPGCGGSDSVPRYSADRVLNAVVEAIVLLKKRYLTAPGARCVLVGHDWGGVVGYRIAADTRGLFDAMVTMNSVHAVALEAEVRRRFARAGQPGASWTAELGPVFNQLRKSNYTFLLQLNAAWPKYLPIVSSALLRYVHRSGEHRYDPHVTPSALASSLTSSYGPSPAECTPQSSSPDTPSYGPTVLARAQTSPPGDWDARFRLYREGLILDPWTLASAHAAHAVEITDAGITQPSDAEVETGERRLEVDRRERFKYPVTVIFGVEDEALDHRIVVDPLEDFFLREEDVRLQNEREEREKGKGRGGKDSEKEDRQQWRESKIVKLEGVGHWSPMMETAREVLIEEVRLLLK